MPVALGVADGTAGEGALVVGVVVADGVNIGALVGTAVAGTRTVATIVAVCVGMTSVAAVLAVAGIISVTFGAHAASTISGRSTPIKRQVFKADNTLPPLPLSGGGNVSR